MRFSSPVDLYLGISSESVSPGNVFLVNSADSLVLFTGELIPWRSAVAAPFTASLFGDVPADALPPATYDLYFIAVPSGTLNNYYFWVTSFEVRTGQP